MPGRLQSGRRCDDQRAARAASSRCQEIERTILPCGRRDVPRRAAAVPPAERPELDATIEGMGSLQVDGCICCQSSKRLWNWKVQPEEFKPPVGVLQLPDGKLVTLTAVGGEGAATANQLKAATHSVSGPNGQAFAVKVTHADDEAIGHESSYVQVLDLEGNELAAARMINTTTMPLIQNPRHGDKLFGLASNYQGPTPHAAINAQRRPETTGGETGEEGLLVTAGGKDYAILAGRFTGFHPGCAGLAGQPGKAGIKGTRGSPGVKGVKGCLE